jgi:TolB-like protein/tetratricopeptide (TPR) repeat protein
MPSVLRFDRFEVDLASGQVRKNGLRIHLREQCFQILASLLERPGQVVSRDDLRRRLWPDDVTVDFENNLNRAIATLREALGDSAERPRFVETLPKRGYRFLAEVSDVTPSSEPGRPRRVGLVVLPFANLSADPAQEYFSDAMTDEVITELASVAPDLGVIARTTAMRYKGTQKDVRQIGHELRVDYVVEGGVRCEADHVTITTQLIRVSDQTHLLARRYESDLAAVFDLRSAAAEAIVGQLGVKRQTPAGARAQRKPTSDLEAYMLYVRGRSHLGKLTSENVVLARRYLEEAIARDPAFALAYDALAELHFFVGFWGLAPAKEVSGTGMFYAMRALDIDDTLAETHALLGLYRKGLDFNWAEVKREMDRARELDPTSPLVRVRYAQGWLLHACRFDEAVAEIELALESDPQSTFMRAWLLCMYWLKRDYDRAIQQGRVIVDFDPDAPTGYWMLGSVLREQCLFDDAIAAHRRAVELSHGSPLMLGWLGLALGQAGLAAEARVILERLHAISRAAYVPPTSFAWTYLGLGDVDETFAWMNRAVDARDYMMIPIQSYPFLDPVRSDPRYFALLKKMNYDSAGAGIHPQPLWGTRPAAV